MTVEKRIEELSRIVAQPWVNREASDELESIARCAVKLLRTQVGDPHDGPVTLNDCTCLECRSGRFLETGIVEAEHG